MKKGDKVIVKNTEALINVNDTLRILTVDRTIIVSTGIIGVILKEIPNHLYSLKSLKIIQEV